jgi:hypothetical protein
VEVADTWEGLAEADSGASVGVEVTDAWKGVAEAVVPAGEELEAVVELGAVVDLEVALLAVEELGAEVNLRSRRRAVRGDS